MNKTSKYLYWDKNLFSVLQTNKLTGIPLENALNSCKLIISISHEIIRPQSPHLSIKYILLIIKIIKNFSWIEKNMHIKLPEFCNN